MKIANFSSVAIIKKEAAAILQSQKLARGEKKKGGD